MMRTYGSAAIADLLGDQIAYRSLRPIDARLPGLAELRPGPAPRKGEPAYAEVVAAILRAARPHIQRVIVVGDTPRSDGGCFTTLCAATGWRGRALICDEQRGAAPTMRHDGALAYANSWQALYAFQAQLEAEEFPVDADTAVVLDIDKTLVGAKGRNHRMIDQARLRALRAAVAAELGERFDSAGFEAIYRELDQARYHPLTEDNNDYVAYLCVLIGAGALRANEPAQLVAEGRRLPGELAAIGARVAGAAPALAPFHRAIAERIAAGDPTPFKAFRRREYRETAQLFGAAGADAEELLGSRIVITAELWDVAQVWAQRGALLFGLSDKPDEAALPTDEDAAAGALPLHRIATALVGQS